MTSRDTERLSRREFLGGAMLAGASGLLGLPSEPSSYLAQGVAGGSSLPR